MVWNSEFFNLLMCWMWLLWFSYLLLMKLLSFCFGSFSNLSYLYSIGVDGWIEMVLNVEIDWKNFVLDGYFFCFFKFNGFEWLYLMMGVVGFVFFGFISLMFVIVMSNMIEVFYYSNLFVMESKIKEFVFIYIGIGVYVVVVYLI